MTTTTSNNVSSVHTAEAIKEFAKLFCFALLPPYVECNDISTRSIRSFDNLFFKFKVSLPLVTGELLQKTVDVNSVKYKLYNIKI